MQSNDKFSLLYTCRTCTKDLQGSVRYGINLLKNQNISSNDKHIFKKISELFNLVKLMITPDDGLPQQICDTCKDVLIMFYSFQTVCERSQLTLTNYFKRTLETQSIKEDSLEQSSSNNLQSLGKTEKNAENSTMNTINNFNQNTFEFLNIDELTIDESNYKLFSSDHLYNTNTKQNDNQSDNCLTQIDAHHSTNDNEIFEKLFVKIENDYNDINIKIRDNSDPVNSLVDVHDRQLEFTLNVNNVLDVIIDSPKTDSNKNRKVKNNAKSEEILDLQDSPYKCPNCNQIFDSTVKRNAHLRINCKDKHFECDICHRRYKDKHALRKHLLSVHVLSEHKCPHCSMEFTRKVLFNYHLKSHDPNQKLKCKYCDKSFLQAQHLINHERGHTGDKPYLCKECGKGFFILSVLQQHERAHTGERPHACSLCDKRFKTPSTLQSHKLTHTGDKPHKCELCGKAFTRTNHLKVHLAKAHYSFDMNNITVHTTATSNNKQIFPYPCTLCNRSFKLASSLTSHLINGHNKERKFECGECGGKFMRLDHLRTHLNTVHLKKRPYSCEYCDKRFSQSGDRNAHVRVHHTYETPYACKTCGKKFHKRRTLIMHVRMHTGERPYKCELCLSQFITYNALSDHTISKHPPSYIQQVK